MCVYCMVADHTWKFDPPWHPHQYPPYNPNQPLAPGNSPNPLTPAPMPGVQISPWTIDRLKEYRDLLKEIHDLEEKVGCPCEPSKADYLNLLNQRIAYLKGLADAQRAQPGTATVSSVGTTVDPNLPKTTW